MIKPALGVLLSLVVSLNSYAQSVETEASWKLFRFFIGTWTGAAQGEPGTGTSTRGYQFILGDNFIQENNSHIYQPQDKNPKGEHHQHMSMLSYDKSRKTFVLRQFHQESFVVQYKLDSISEDGKRIIFVTELMENFFQESWRGRETYTIVNDNEFVELFELAPPNKEFFAYSTTSYKRNMR